MRAIVVLPISFLAGLCAGYALFQRTVSSPGAETRRDHYGEIHGTASRIDDASSTDEKAQRFLAAALRKGRGVDRYSEVYLAIQALNADDFRRMLTDLGALKAIIEKLWSIEYPFSRDLTAGVIDRWLAVDPAAVTTWLPRIFDLIPKKDGARNLLLEVMSERRPEELLALVASQKDPQDRAEIISRALRKLAAKDLAKARAWIDGCTDPADRRTAEQAMRLGIVETDPLRAIELANGCDNRSEAFNIIMTAGREAAKMGPGTSRQLVTMPMKSWMLSPLIREFAEQDPESAVDLALKSLSGSDANAEAFLLQAAISSLARRDSALAISKLDGLKGPLLASAVSAIGSEWASRDPAAALSWLMEKPASERASSARRGFGTNDSLLYTFTDWFSADREAARTWADSLPAGEKRNQIQTQMAQALAYRGGAAEATQVLARLGEAADPKALSEVAGAWARSDPGAAADWAIAQPAGAIQNQALAKVVGTWANDNPVAAQDWLAQFPAGEARDRSIAAYLMRFSSYTQNAASQIADFETWFDLIDDPWQRALVARKSYWDRKNRDPEAARTWLSSIPNVDQGLIQITLRYEDN